MQRVDTGTGSWRPYSVGKWHPGAARSRRGRRVFCWLAAASLLAHGWLPVLLQGSLAEHQGGKSVTYNMEITSPNSVQRQGWGRNSLLPGEKVVFEGYAGKVDETRGSLLSIAKLDAPDKPLFVQGGPEAVQQGFPGAR